ncbi:tRNA preQ1(34) S-adenosylmethionine ribosyltransferase-isomerase QueA [Metallumcola ferriviriculae]|uniref:S-adenosylmethionine:tRNA ribosyltransferase-isomerase n=1 Tax=Metallumcola ferriviriculae TaxID=3039180 RepID=A0AAU0USI7_9FIRM|nr:tRNA preQ1(34) S-adenosylmethionine ribosyltransferase-isomerase QueA [Desulfitibacteraceae bacterium MK1]
MRVSDFEYNLPEQLIAQHPVMPRDASRLLVLDRHSDRVTDEHFSHIVDYLSPGDVLVVNDTRVIPARLFGIRQHTGAKIEVLLLKQIEEDSWETLVKPGKKARPGEVLIFGDGMMTGEVLDITSAGGRVIRFHYEGIFQEILSRLGEMPLPPYIRESLGDPERYQTAYAREEGSAAAPTAGLHFTPQLLARIKEKGIKVVSVLLHVGLGTFRPVSAENVAEHHMHAEYYRIDVPTVNSINRAREQGNKVFAVGTTVVRTLETAAPKGKLVSSSGWTDIFIYPGYDFQIVDGLITNFHLPRSTLLMLVSAFAGREKVLAAYNHAVTKKYRFFSFGDAMLIV